VEYSTPFLLRAMEDLYTRFTNEMTENIAEARKLFDYLADSFYGSTADLARIRDVYRGFMDLKTFAVSKNAAITKPDERSWRGSLQTKEVMNEHINTEINPFIEILQFVIELYEEDRAA
jgi:hypothetical protein